MEIRTARLAGVGVALATAVALAAAPATAINTYNAEPAPERTETGAFIVLWDRDGGDGINDRFDWYCSGAMVDDDTFLTAAHCTVDWPEGARFFVSLEQDVQTALDDAWGDLEPTDADDVAEAMLAAGLVVEGDVFWDEGFAHDAADSHDIGVVDFSDNAKWETTPQDEWDFVPATLPTAGLLDTLTRAELNTSEWWVVGYGTEEAMRGAGGQTHPGGGVRLKAQEGFSALNKSWVRLKMIESQGWGGACYGDSGGPNFIELDGNLILVATTITGDVPCYATNVVYRTDTVSARTFLSDFVDLP